MAPVKQIETAIRKHCPLSHRPALPDNDNQLLQGAKLSDFNRHSGCPTFLGTRESDPRSTARSINRLPFSAYGVEVISRISPSGPKVIP
jgi:hypothetical protein